MLYDFSLGRVEELGASIARLEAKWGVNEEPAAYAMKLIIGASVFTEKEQAEFRANNRLVLMSFVNYCAANPDQRFWQALSNWSGRNIFVMAHEKTISFADGFLRSIGAIDTWEWKGHRE